MSGTVLLTGTSSGLGQALVEAFARRGWNVTATMRDTSRAPASYAGFDNVLVAPLDVLDQASIDAAVAASQERFGAPDVLVNVAAYVQAGSLEETTIDQIRAEYETNVFGTLAVTRSVLPAMCERGSGHVMAFSSAAGVVAMPGMAAYASSKFALEGYYESLAFDLARHGIKTTIVEPGVFATKLGDNASPPATKLDAYTRDEAQLAAMFDFTPGNIAAAAEAVVSIAGRPDAPLRLYVGHGLDDVRRRYQEHLDTWAAQEHLTRATV